MAASKGETAPQVTQAEIVHQGGMVLRRTEAGWHVPYLGGAAILPVCDPRLAAQSYGLLPIMVRESQPGGRVRDLLLCKGDHKVFGLKISDMESLALQKGVWDIDVGSVFYLLRGVEHHCGQLAKAYEAVCDSFCLWPEGTVVSDPEVIYGGQEEIYYEAEALLTAIHRTYSALRLPLWKWFGRRGKKPPGEYRPAVDGCRNQTLPPGLARRIDTNWELYGKGLKEYRDCLQHNTPIDFGHSAVRMQKLPSGPWVVRAHIPDNPSVRSHHAFTFALKRDALDYGWDGANEILVLSAAIVDTIANRTQVSQSDASAVTGEKPACS